MTFTEENSIDSTSRALLRIISCSELQNEVPRALRELLHAATEDGVFYLKFDDDGDKRKWSRSIESVDRLSHDIFDLSTEEKLLFDIDSMEGLKLNGFVLHISSHRLLSIQSTLTRIAISQLAETKAA
jgi:isopenicillin N synthase-like dioxygenase